MALTVHDYIANRIHDGMIVMIAVSPGQVSS